MLESPDSTLSRLDRGLDGPRRGAAPELEAGLTEVLVTLVEADEVAAEAHFFDDLGADSMVMARFCARLRKRDDLPTVSMKDIYAHPSIAALASAFAPQSSASSSDHGSAPANEQAVEVAAAPTTVAVIPAASLQPAGEVVRSSTASYVLCGALQLIVFLGYCAAYGLVAFHGYAWISQATTVVQVYLRAAAFGGGGFLALCLLPILGKWLVIGRWRPTRIRVWSLGYFRFWFAKLLIRSNPLVLLALGSPLYAYYLRALGAKVGPGVTILTKSVPVCTDLITLGAGTVVRKDAHLTGYRARAGFIEIGPVTLGRDVVLGDKTVLDIDTSMGDGAQLGHSSALQSGQHVPAGERWHGSPAVPTDVDYRLHGGAPVGAGRRVGFAISQVLGVALVAVPLAVGAVTMLLVGFPRLARVLDSSTAELADPAFYLEALGASAALFFGLGLLGLLGVTTVPKLLNAMIEPDRVYPLFGFHHGLHQAIMRMTNVKFFTYLFGDSSYILHYFRRLGMDVSLAEQTGSNFGTGVVQETPFLSTVGQGTMVADGLSIVNADYSNTSFRVSRTTIGAHNFLGNHIAYPSQGRTGENCLLATKVMVPMDGPVRENVGLLGSPPFEIPRTVQRDSRLDPADAADLARRLHAKNKNNIVSMGLGLLARWMHIFGVTVLAMVIGSLLHAFGPEAVALEVFLGLLFTMVFFVLVERAYCGFKPLRPQHCSIYDPYFWWHERYWKLVTPQFDKFLNGTPFKNLMSRALGVRLGARVFDDGCFLPEKTLATIGDDCMLNETSTVQCHSQEDGGFKSDYTVLGAGCTVGVATLVHYGVVVGDGTQLLADSFVMKGEELPAYAVWGGNPAEDLTATPTRDLDARANATAVLAR